MKRYHDGFPAAPQALVSGLSAACTIPSIVGARVGSGDGSVYLDIFTDTNFHLHLDHLLRIADFFGVDSDQVHVEAGPRAETVTVIVCATDYDFTINDRVPALPGEEDSEESIEAHASLASSRS